MSMNASATRNQVRTRPAAAGQAKPSFHATAAERIPVRASTIGIARADADAAVGAAAAQDEVAQDRDVLQRRDRRLAGGAGGAGHDEIEALFRRGCAGRVAAWSGCCDLRALLAPLALHHDGYAVDDHVEEAAHDQAEHEADADEEAGRRGEEGDHGWAVALSKKTPRGARRSRGVEGELRVR